MSIEAEKRNIDIFIEELRQRLHQKADEEYTGWNRGHWGKGDDNGRLPPTASTPDLAARLVNAYDQEKFIDVAAFAGMLWRRQVIKFKAAEKMKEKI